MNLLHDIFISRIYAMKGKKKKEEEKKKKNKKEALLERQRTR